MAPTLVTGPGQYRRATLHPGDTLILTRTAQGRPRLREARVVHLSPRVREQPLQAAIPTIPYAAIRAFLHAPRLVDADTLNSAPYIMAFDDAHMVAGAGATVYIRGVRADSPRRFTIVRDAGAYRNPDTGAALGRQAVPVGEVRITRFGPVTVGEIETSQREAQAGDRLLPLAPETLARDLYPQPPDRPLVSRVISVYGGPHRVSQYQIVTVQGGRAAGLNRGTVLTAYAAGQTVIDPLSGKRVDLPAQRSGTLMIFKTAGAFSFGLIMHATRAIRVGDTVRSPGA